MELKRITHAENVRLSDSGRAVRILDQSRLPNETVYLELSQAEDLYEAIASLRVRGAPAIGIAAAYAVCPASSPGMPCTFWRCKVRKPNMVPF